jgi:hypothetical protein
MATTQAAWRSEEDAAKRYFLPAVVTVKPWGREGRFSLTDAESGIIFFGTASCRWIGE